MQERQMAGEADQRAPSWYLARGDKKYGPLADRELLLLAERGGLRTDDLLWKPGFDTWKSVHAFCDVGTAQSASPLPASTPSDAFAGAEVDASDIGAPAHQKKSLRARAYQELRKFLIIFAYLWLVFFVFFLHEWVVLANNNIGFRFYGLAVVNALVLSKIMLIAESLKFADGLKNRPLIYPIAFKSISFAALLMVSYIAEEIVVGLFHGSSMAESFPKIGGGGLVGVLIVSAIMCIALVPFFAIREIARAIGEAEFRTLMLGPAKEERASNACPADGLLASQH
jgi:hypothetical protein